MSFADPWFLALLPLPLLLMRLLPPVSVEGTAVVVPEATASRYAGAGEAPRSIRARLLWPGLLWCLLVLALAGPRQIEPTPALPISGRDLVIALDLSGSMVRDDFALNGEEITRLDAVKQVGARFVRGRGGDRVGLVIFGSEAYVAEALTYDVEAIARTIEEAVIGISGRATNIGDGLGLALKRLDASDAETRVVILLSDGSNNAGAAKPRDVARLAAEMGVRVHTIALGPKDLTTAAEGERGVVDAATLRAMSEISGGETFRVRTYDDLQAVAEAIDALEATDRDGMAAEVFRPLWIWPAALAFLIAAALPVLRREAL